ncbi:MAG: hypothetical protein GOMPHAMPRED_006148 [Gomphillus americanus]|uniref:A-kinase anchor protein 7-like phosphoesterase domain-containing protein n=1 Tax=Gomphillus americanus TaxID=1940652 RepID=A0A8H3EKI7_9LECA|nr:MAG: hypothetical protein GOMPHAMPRED_006148 [Gomphillus americanus]
MPSARPTHFLCLPLVTPASLPQFTASLALFARDKAIQQNSSPGKWNKQKSPPREKKRSNFDADGSDEHEQPVNAKEGYVPIKAVRPVGPLHLTLGVMHLDSKDKVDAASEFLKAIDMDILLNEVTQSFDRALQHSKPLSQSHPMAIGSAPAETEVISSASPKSYSQSRQEQTQLVVQLKGLHTMQQPSKTRVLFAEPIDASERLSSFCQLLRNKFINEGFMIDEERDLKLHATIVNTIYASKHGRNSASKRRMEFDASDLIERWKEKVWAEVTITKVAICEMGAKEDATGQVKYQEVAERIFGL